MYLSRLDVLTEEKGEFTSYDAYGVYERYFKGIELDYIKELKPHYQEIINLRYFREMTYKEMAAQLNEPIGNIKVKLLRAKKLLAATIEKSSIT